MLDTTHQVALLIHCIQDARPNLKPPPHLVLWRGDHRRRLRVSRAQGSTTPESRQDHRSGRCRWCCRPCRWFGLGFHLPQACNGNIVPNWAAGDIIFVTWRVREPHVNLKEVFFGNVYMLHSCYVSSSPVGWSCWNYDRNPIASEVDQIQEPTIWSCWHYERKPL